MAISSFEELCRGLCEVAGLPAPDLSPGANGDLAIEVELPSATIVVSHGSRSGPDRAAIFATFGKLPAERQLEAADALLAINCKVLGLGFAYSLNPANGDIVLQQAYPFESASAVDLYQRLLKMAEGIEGWRRHFFLAEA